MTEDQKKRLQEQEGVFESPIKLSVSNAFNLTDELDFSIEIEQP
jgi:hypothetical protein